MPDGTTLQPWKERARAREKVQARGGAMELALDDEQAAELALLLDEALHDLTGEIADTDNAQYRQLLRRRRALVEDLRSRLDVG